MKTCFNAGVGLAATLLAGPLFAAPARPPVTAVSHIAVFSSDAEKTESFYVRGLGAVKGADPENPEGVRYYVSPGQFVEVLPLESDGINRLDHIAFVTEDAERMRQYLNSKGVAVPSSVTVGADGSRYFSVADPEGNRVEFTQGPVVSPNVPENLLSGHSIHVGLIIHDRALADTFYRDILGFRPYWYGGFEDDKPIWVSQQVPDGRDWIEYMLVDPPTGQGIPEGMSQRTAGVLNHFALGVPNIQAAYTRLWNEGRLQEQDELPKIGRDAKWQLNLYDPDGTRAELMELRAIGTPCCSPFTAEDPEK